MTKNRLGRGIGDIAAARGLEYLLPTDKAVDEVVNLAAGRPIMAEIERIDLNPDQPRRNFAEQELAALAQSIRSLGVTTPLMVRPKDGGRYELIDGERRLRAARLAGLEKVPIILRDRTDDPSELIRLALGHNMCREDLNPIEEAEAFSRLEQEFSYTHQQIAEMFGQDRSTVTNAVRLLKLPENIRDDIRYKRLSPGHGRALLALVDQGILGNLRQNIIVKKLSVRQVENLIKRVNKKRKTTQEGSTSNDQAYYDALSEAFSLQLHGLKVKITPQGQTKKMEIFYSRQEELEWLMTRLGVEVV